MNLSRNVLVYFIGKLVPALSQLIILVFGVKLLGTAEFGKYNLLFSTSMIISSLMVGWIQQSALRFFFELTGSGVKKATNFYSLAFSASITAFLITLVFCLLYFHIGFYELLIVSGFTALFSVFLVSLTLKQANNNPVAFAAAESFFYTVTIIIFLSGAFFYSMRDSILLFEGMLASLVIWFIIRILMTKNISELFSGVFYQKPGKSFFRKMFVYGAPITVWLLISNFYNVFDRYIINYYWGFDAVGIYGSVYDLIFKISGFMTLPVLLSYHPAISRAWSGEDYSMGKELIVQAVLLELLIMLVMFSGLYFFSDYIFETLFSKSIPDLGSLFIPIALSALLWQISMVIQKPLEFNFRQKLMISGILFTFISNGLLNIFTVPVFGYVAAGYNTLICTSIYFLFVLYYAGAELKLKLQKINK
jgi:O-antigen/teichoic acid export membrane protein